MAEHDLKTWPGPFQAILDGTKPWEFRRNDRNYQVGDTLRLREWEPFRDPCEFRNSYTGREITVEVTYILNGPAHGIPEGYCIATIQRLDRISVPVFFRTVFAGQRFAEVALATTRIVIPYDGKDSVGRDALQQSFDTAAEEYQRYRKADGRQQE